MLMRRPAVICYSATAAPTTIVPAEGAITSGTVTMALTIAPGYVESVTDAAARMHTRNVACIVRVS